MEGTRVLKRELNAEYEVELMERIERFHKITLKIFPVILRAQESEARHLRGFEGMLYDHARECSGDSMSSLSMEIAGVFGNSASRLEKTIENLRFWLSVYKCIKKAEHQSREDAPD